MIVFQLIALPIILLLFLRSAYRLIRGDRPLWGPILGVLVWAAAGVAILRPQLTTEVARFLGIGRGADLLLYLVAIAFVVSLFYVYQRFRKLESDLTRIVRNQALEEGDLAGSRGEEEVRGPSNSG